MIFCVCVCVNALHGSLIQGLHPLPSITWDAFLPCVLMAMFSLVHSRSVCSVIRVLGGWGLLHCDWLALSWRGENNQSPSMFMCPLFFLERGTAETQTALSAEKEASLQKARSLLQGVRGACRVRGFLEWGLHVGSLCRHGVSHAGGGLKVYK